MGRRERASAGSAMTVYGLVDCNNFFVSCERVFRPKREGRLAHWELRCAETVLDSRGRRPRALSVLDQREPLA